MSQHPLVIYHHPCTDGLVAAWVLRQVFQGAEFEFLGKNYGQELPDPESLAWRFVWAVDFSFPIEYLKQLLLHAKGVTILDHHKTAIERLGGFSDPKLRMVLDPTKSGARLTWEYLRPASAPVPALVQYTEDYDLWRHQLLDSQQVNAFISSWPLTFDGLDRVNEALTHDFSASARQGAAILRYKEQLIERLVASAMEIRFLGYTIPVVNTPVIISEVGNRLSNCRTFAMTWFQEKDGMARVSLRSPDDGIDVSEIAKRFGGGGHPHAAGFSVPLQQMEMILNGSWGGIKA